MTNILMLTYQQYHFISSVAKNVSEKQTTLEEHRDSHHAKCVNRLEKRCLAPLS